MTRSQRRRLGWLAVVAACGFVAGVLATIAVVGVTPSGIEVLGEAPTASSTPNVEVRPSLKETPLPVEPPPKADALPAISADPVEDRRERHLTLPVKGITREDLRDTFNEMRGGTRRHEALDVLAPRNTPVVAVEDGKIARLFLSEAGGITVYQYDPTGTYVYYYAHLEAYAPGLHEGDSVTRGEVIGFVGTTGNAPRDTPHLHFAIFRMTDEKKWWQGTAIDPFLVFQ